ncbi:aromatic ring-opening dioxygenase LigA, partial [Thalassiella azotivora]
MSATLAAPVSSTPATTPATASGSRIVRLLAVLVMVGGVVLAVGGAATWGMVQTSLGDEKITVAEDAQWFAGEPVDGPLTAYSQADIIEKHALEGAEGMTYAELDREDPRRAMVMNGSFLRASLFTSVVSFGVAAMAMGLG